MRPRLNRLHIGGYRSLREVALTLGDLTVLIGPNGAGKSNLLDALRCLNALRRGGLRSFVGQAGGASTLLHRSQKPSDSIKFELFYTREAVDDLRATDYAVTLRPTQDDGLIIETEWMTLEPADRPDVRTVPGQPGRRESSLLDELHPDAPRVLQFPAFSVYHFHDTSSGAPLRTPARAGDDQQLREDGGNLPALLLRLRDGQSPEERVAWSTLLRKVREVAPPVHLLRPTWVNGGPDPRVRLDWEDVQGNVFGPHQLSDGTLRAIALLAALHQPERPALMAFDEPELGLHPAALSTIAAALRSASAQSQVLVATQSPLLLDEVQAEDVVVCELGEGATRLRRLDAPALDGWLEHYTLADLWQMSVLGGRP